jgi:hypothetical protein
VIDTVLNLLFRCHHKRLTRPITPVSKAGVPDGDTYVVCLACGKQFAYDWNEMRIGKSVAISPTGAGPQNQQTEEQEAPLCGSGFGSADSLDRQQSPKRIQET